MSPHIIGPIMDTVGPIIPTIMGPLVNDLSHSYLIMGALLLERGLAAAIAVRRIVFAKFGGQAAAVPRPCEVFWGDGNRFA